MEETSSRPSDDRVNVVLRERIDALEAENAQLRTTRASKVVIEQAKGALSARLGVSSVVAFQFLCSVARSSGRDIHEVAVEVVARGGHVAP
jgi:AmiR/NasT family two-component response regulator